MTANEQEQEAKTRFGAELRQIRELQRISLRELARAASVSAPYLHNLESGQAALPSPHTLLALAQALRVPYRDLFIEAGYPLPDTSATERRGPGQRPRGALLGDVLEQQEITGGEAHQLAEYLTFLRARNR